jgi:hypothetical protein
MHFQQIAQRPEQRHFRIGVQFMANAVHSDGRHVDSFMMVAGLTNRQPRR